MAILPTAPTQTPYNYLAIPVQIGPVSGTLPISMSDINTLLFNPTSSSMTYSWVPPHGRVIAAGAAYLVDGDVFSTLTSNSRYSRRLNALKNDVQNGYLNVFRNLRQLVSVPVTNTVTVNVGDFIYIASNLGLPASSFTWDTNIATTQGEIKAVFMGISTEAKGVTTGTQNILVDVSPTSTYLCPCVSATHHTGDTMGVAKAAGSSLLSNALASAAADDSIARVVQGNTSLATVLVRFQSAYWGENASDAQ